MEGAAGVRLRTYGQRPGSPFEAAEKEGEWCVTEIAVEKGAWAHFSGVLWATRSCEKCLKRREHVLGRVKSIEKIQHRKIPLEQK